MEPRIIMQNVPQHLCVTCKFVSKCRRFKTVHQQLSDVEADALDKWKLDVDVSYMIRECDMYTINWDMVNALQEAYGMIDDDDEGDE